MSYYGILVMERSIRESYFRPIYIIRHNSADSIPTSNLVCINMASILKSQSRDLKYGGTFSNHCEVLMLLMGSHVRLKDQVY